MASFEFTSPEGKKYTVEGPDGATQEQAFKMLQKQIGATAPKEAPPRGLVDSAIDFAKKDIAAIPGRIGNMAAGAVRGAGSIGATIMAPKDIISDALDGKGLSLESNRQRRADMTGALQSMGADPNSPQFQFGKGALEVAGTAGVGNALAVPLRLAGAAPSVVNAVSSGGMSGGGNALTRLLGGAANGGATASLVDPNHVGAGVILGGALPGAAKLAGTAGNAIYNAAEAGANRLMQSAIKPTIAQLKSGDAATAVKALLEYGISPTKAGVNKLRDLIDGLNSQISAKIATSPATISKTDVLDVAWPTRAKFANQVDPLPDLNAIDNVAERFYFHPKLPSDAIPVQVAQDLKQGTYQALSKKYGQIGSADTEAQKALARGLKEGIAKAVPDVAGLNAEESELITTLNVAERRALMELNKNPVGLTALARNPIAAAGFLADRSAAFKALAARMINAATPTAGAVGQRLLGTTSNPLLRAAALNEASP